MSSNIKKNIVASIQARLKNVSKTEGVNLDYILSRYGIERFLYRLSCSAYKNNYVLKGASLFTVWLGPSFRTTKDADFLCNGNSDPEYLVKCFQEICQIESDDGIIFDLDSIRTKDIRRGLQYGGTCIMMIAFLGKIRIPIQCDIGFGDSIYPGVETVEYPTILDMDKPELRAYPVYTVIAEKFEAMVTLDMANSRLKDFYDLWLLTEQFNFDYLTLKSAVIKTFERRKTVFPEELPTALTKQFAQDNNKQIQWKAFLKKTTPKQAPASFEAAINRIREFISPLIDNDITEDSQWTAADSWHSLK